MNSMSIGIFLCFLFCLFNRFSFADPLYYRSAGSGFWDQRTTWETSADAGFSSLLPVAVAPDSSVGTIFIQAGDTVIIRDTLTIDEVIVEEGGVLVYGNYPSVLTIHNGQGTDLLVYGTFEDSGPENLTWRLGASWMFGSNGTMIRTRSTSATAWRDHYENGIASIPATSNWILRKQNTDQPSLSSVSSYYGNLIVENFTASFWNANVVGSKITGISSAPVIKGNFEIGTGGLNGVKFYSQNSAVNRIAVKGNVSIGATSELRLEDAPTTSGASGLEIGGDLVVHGTLSYDPVEVTDQNRMIRFSGTNDQYISGEGNISIYNLTNHKTSGNLILNRALTVDHIITLEEGAFMLHQNTLSLPNSATNALSRINGWIVSETSDQASTLTWKIDIIGMIYEFPFGKNKQQYIPFRFSLQQGNAGVVKVSTYATSVANLPLPVFPVFINNLDVNGSDYALHTVDRFWYIDCEAGCTATLEFSYSTDERPSGSSPLQARRFNTLTNLWEDPLCCQTQNAQSVKIPNVTAFAEWTLMEENDALQIREQQSSSVVLNRHEPTSLYPSPFSDELFIRYEQPCDSELWIEIENQLGRKIFTRSWYSKKGSYCLPLDLSTLPEKGLMIVKLIRNDSIETFKLVRE